MERCYFEMQQADEVFVFTVSDCAIVKGTFKDVTDQTVTIQVDEVISTCYPKTEIPSVLVCKYDELLEVQRTSEVSLSMTRLQEDIRIVLSLKGYSPSEVEAFENSCGEVLELQIETESKADPLELVVDSIEYDGSFELTLDVLKTLQLVYGTRVTGYSFDGNDILIEFKKETNYENN